MRRIGIDVGGTNTDAVLVSEGRVEDSVKAPTTADVTGGIIEAMRRLRERCGTIGDVRAVLVGTTHFINAVVQRRDLAKVGAVRIGPPATTALPPFVDWPEDLARLVNGGVWFVTGGHDYDGRRFERLDVAALRQAGREIHSAGLSHIAVSAMFSPLDASDEEAAAEILRNECPSASITCSHA